MVRRVEGKATVTVLQRRYDDSGKATDQFSEFGYDDVTRVTVSSVCLTITRQTLEGDIINCIPKADWVKYTSIKKVIEEVRAWNDDMDDDDDDDDEDEED